MNESASQRVSKWAFIVLLLLLAWGLRLCCLEEVPPGWRDDELINIHALSNRLLQGEFPVYYLGASGHEPLYHHLHAGVHAVLGFNVLSGHILSVAFGMLSIALTYSVVRQLFPRVRAAAIVAALTLTTSFWSLMYSRTAIRHISLPPFVLATVYALWRRLGAERSARGERLNVIELVGLTGWRWVQVQRTNGKCVAPRRGERPNVVELVGLTVWRWVQVQRTNGKCVAPRRGERPNVVELVGSTGWRWVPVGFLLGASLYTYTASRLLPVLLIVFLFYLALFHRERLQGQWRGIAVAFVVMTVTVAPLAIAIVQGRSKRAIEGIGADARVTELAGPLRALQGGEIQPLLISMARTLGMFHASGDPEWLYNISGRPVFGLFGGILLWMGVALCICRWRQPSYFFLLPWLGLGLLPAFISTPPASLSHTIFAQPVAYILPALAVVEIARGFDKLTAGTSGPVMGLGAAFNFILIVFVVSNAVRDLRDYFVVWPERGMVRLLYRADQREAADYLDAHPEITDVAIGSGLMGPWDRIAMEVDVERENVVPRLFNPERTLVWAAGRQRSPGDDPSVVLLPSWPDPIKPIEMFLGPGTDVSAHGSMQSPPLSPPQRGGDRGSAQSRLALYTPPFVSDAEHGDKGHLLNDAFDTCQASEVKFANGLTLSQVHWLQGESLAPGEEVGLVTVWHVSEPLDLPPMPIVAQPPPPEIYSGPRLAVFAHLVDVNGRALDIDDGLWVDPLTLQPGDRFVQVHRFAVPSDPAPHSLLPAPVPSSLLQVQRTNGKCVAPNSRGSVSHRAPVQVQRTNGKCVAPNSLLPTPVPGATAPEPHALELGLYDPKTNHRWSTVGTDGEPGADLVHIPIGEQLCPP